MVLRERDVALGAPVAHGRYERACLPYLQDMWLHDPLENLQPSEYSHMAVNFRMFSSIDISKFRIQNFDGADTWEFLD